MFVEGGVWGVGGLRSLRSLRPLPQSASSSLRDNSHLAGPAPYTCPGVDKPPDTPHTSLKASAETMSERNNGKRLPLVAVVRFMNCLAMPEVNI